MDKMIRVDNLENLLTRLGLFRQSYDAIMREVSYLEVPAIQISENATNGDIRRAMFPNEKVIELDDIVIVMGKDKEYQHHYSKDFWNAPYKGGQEDGE